MKGKTMPCPRTVLLSACLDPGWTGRRRALIVAHVRTCPVCAAELDALRSLSDGLRALPSPVLDVDLSRWHRTVPLFAWLRKWRDGWAWVPASLAVTASLLAGISLGNLPATPAASAQPVEVAFRLDLFNPVPPGGLCVAAGLCGVPQERT